MLVEFGFHLLAHAGGVVVAGVHRGTGGFGGRRPALVRRLTGGLLPDHGDEGEKGDRNGEAERAQGGGVEHGGLLVEPGRASAG